MSLLKRLLWILLFIMLVVNVGNYLLRKRTERLEEPFVVIKPISARFFSFERIRERLPPDATMAEVVAASDFVPSPEELQMMSYVELVALIKGSAEKSDVLFSQVKTYTSEWLDYKENLTRGAKTPGEVNAILTAYSDMVTTLHKGVRSAEYEYYVHQITFHRATKEWWTRGGGQNPIIESPRMLELFESLREEGR